MFTAPLFLCDQVPDENRIPRHLSLADLAQDRRNSEQVSSPNEIMEVLIDAIVPSAYDLSMRMQTWTFVCNALHGLVFKQGAPPTQARVDAAQT